MQTHVIDHLSSCLSSNIVTGDDFTLLDVAGLLAWYSYNDSSTLTISGNKISQWDDKSPNGLELAQATSGNQPFIATGGVRGDGSNDYLQADAGDFNLLHDDSPWALYLKFRVLDNMEGRLGAILASAPLNADKGIKILYADRAASSEDNMIRVSYGNGVSDLMAATPLSSAGAITRGQVHVMRVYYDGADNMQIYIDNTKVFDHDISGTPGTGNSNIPLSLLSIAGSSACAAKIYEMAVYDAAITPGSADDLHIVSYFNGVVVLEYEDDLLPLAMWLSAKNDNSITDSSGLVDAWGGLSVSGLNATSTLTNRPTYDSANGTIDFIAVNNMDMSDYLDGLHDGTGAALFWVINLDTGLTSVRTIIDTAGVGLDATGDKGVLVQVNASNNRYRIRGGNGGAFLVADEATDDTFTAGTLAIGCIIVDDAAAHGNDFVVYDLVAGAARIQTDKLNNFNTGNSQELPRIGSIAASSANPFDGFINELLYCDYVPTSAEINAIGAKLGQKYGISTTDI